MGHADYVSPETFYLNVSTSFVLRDSVNRIANGKHTMRDFARVIAVHNIGKRQTGTFQGTLPLTDDRAKRYLCVETENIMRDSRFETFLAGANHKQLLQTMKNDASRFNDVWEAYKLQNPIVEQSTAKQNVNQAQSNQPLA